MIPFPNISLIPAQTTPVAMRLDEFQKDARLTDHMQSVVSVPQCNSVMD